MNLENYKFLNIPEKFKIEFESFSSCSINFDNTKRVLHYISPEQLDLPYNDNVIIPVEIKNENDFINLYLKIFSSRNLKYINYFSIKYPFVYILYTYDNIQKDYFYDPNGIEFEKCTTRWYLHQEKNSSYIFKKFITNNLKEFRYNTFFHPLEKFLDLTRPSRITKLDWDNDQKINYCDGYFKRYNNNLVKFIKYLAKNICKEINKKEKLENLRTKLYFKIDFKADLNTISIVYYIKDQNIVNFVYYTDAINVLSSPYFFNQSAYDKYKEVIRYKYRKRHFSLKSFHDISLKNINSLFSKNLKRNPKQLFKRKISVY